MSKHQFYMQINLNDTSMENPEVIALLFSEYDFTY